MTWNSPGLTVAKAMEKLIETEVQGTVRVLRLSGGRGNCLGPDLLAALSGAFGAGTGEEARPTVLAARGRSFCTGLDLVYALGQDRHGMGAYMDRFHAALRAVFAYPAPVVAAIGGHAMAGGALLALAADERLVAAGGGRFGIHGVHLGFPYPDVAVETLRYQLARADIEDTLYHGRLRSLGELPSAGLAKLVGGDQSLEAAAVDRAASLAAPSLATFGENKRMLRAGALARMDAANAVGASRWLDHWFDPGTQEKVSAQLAGSDKGERA